MDGLQPHVIYAKKTLYLVGQMVVVHQVKISYTHHQKYDTGLDIYGLIKKSAYANSATQTTKTQNHRNNS